MGIDKISENSKAKNIHCSVVSLMTPPLNGKTPLLGQGLIIKNILKPEYCSNLILNQRTVHDFVEVGELKGMTIFPLQI
jgi:hypothetical protein